ncbi:MAG: glycosyltransferase family 4 protein [Verrucomicrobiota bacterium]
MADSGKIAWRGARPDESIRNLIIVVRADPIICGHSTEARNLAEAARALGFENIHIVSYPLDVLEASPLPLKPLDSVLPYSEGIAVDRPGTVGDYKVLDCRLLYGISGHLVDLLYQFQGRGRTALMDLYLVPHGQMVLSAVHSFAGTTQNPNVSTIAEAVGSDITNVVSNALKDGKFGAAQIVLSNYLRHDLPVAVSEYTKQLIIESGEEVDAVLKTNFAQRLREEVGISYPAIDTSTYTTIDHRQDDVRAALAKRGLHQDNYLLFLSRVVKAKGVDDLIDAYWASNLYGQQPLVICGTGIALPELKEKAAGDPHILFFDDVGDEEKGLLMHGCSAYVFPSKPRPEFTETFGIAVAEKMLAGGLGPVITTRTGGIPEATGGHCLEHAAGHVTDLRDRLNQLDRMSNEEKAELAGRAREFAMRFDRAHVLGSLLERLRQGAVPQAAQRSAVTLPEQAEAG